MSATEIEWTDTTWNPLVGCSMVSPGCARCYAETMSKRIAGMARADRQAGRNPGRKAHYLNVMDDKGRWNGEVELVPEALADPLSWKRPRHVFVNSMSDLFHKNVPFDYVNQVFAVMSLCPQHKFQILTKRPERMAEYLAGKDSPLDKDRWDIISEWAVRIGKIIWDARGSDPANYYGICGGIRGKDFSNRRVPPGWPLPNVWLGTSVEDQQRAKERIPHLLQCPAAVRFLSCEPLLAEINLGEWLQWPDCTCDGEFSPCEVCDARGPREDLSWVIAGGESGPGARPCTIGHIRSLVRQCQAAGVACFVKQLGAKPVNREGVPHPLKDAKGGDPAEWPEDLRVREMPATEGAIQ